MKEQIVQTSLKQFLTYGIKSMKMQKLAADIGISTKTLYKHFSDKEALLQECLKVHYGATDREIQNMLNDDASPVVLLFRCYAKSMELDFGTSHLFYHDLNYYYPLLQDKAIRLYGGKAFTVLNDTIKKGIADGYFLPYLQPAVVMQAITVLYTSVTRQDTYKKFKLKPTDLAKHTINIYLRGICTEKGLEIMDELTN